MKIAIFGSRHQKENLIKRIFDLLSIKNVEIYIQERFYKYIKETFGNIDFKTTEVITGDDFETDMALSIGGDGTFLRTASVVGKKNIPIIGLNTGRLGFLADITDEDIDVALNDILDGKFCIEERTLLQLSTEHHDFKGFNYALNEIAVLKQDSASMITAHAYINGEFLSSYQADGLIVATPTGSTAYSLSVGGPIMSPTSSGFIVTAVAPHSLTSRPLVVDDDCIITLEVESRNESYLISLDGRSTIFSEGTKLTIKRADHKLKVAKRMGHTFYNTLRNKLMWGTDPRDCK